MNADFGVANHHGFVFWDQLWGRENRIPRTQKLFVLVVSYRMGYKANLTSLWPPCKETYMRQGCHWGGISSQSLTVIYFYLFTWRYVIDLGYLIIGISVHESSPYEGKSLSAYIWYEYGIDWLKLFSQNTFSRKSCIPRQRMFIWYQDYVFLLICEV